MEGNTFAVLNKLLNDSTKSYIDKVEGLLLGWKNIYSILFKKPTQPCDDAMNYMHKSTLQYLLHGDWTQLEASLRAKFTVILHKVLTAISKTDQEALRRCKLLIKLVHEPWKNSTLHKILHSLSPTDNEVREYIATEGSELLLMRLEVLCEGKCEDLALKLAATLLKHLRQQNGFKKTDIDYISDTVLILLFRFKRNQEIIEQLKNLDLMEGLDLVKRFARKHTSTSGLWRFCDKVTELAAHTVLASGMVQNVESKERQSILYELVNEWALIHIPKLNKCVSTLCNMVRKIVQKAESPIHVYIFAQVLHKQLGDQVKPLCIELYIRGFTSNINLIERYKSSNDYERTLKAEILLSNSFLELSELLQDNIIIHRECILTAFSLHPTEECFKRLESAALLCCEKCKNEEKALKTDSAYNTWNNCDNISCVHAREKTEEQFIEAVNSLNILNSDLLGLAPHLCDDLSTVLCSPRCQTLSWSLGWSRLKKQCEKYLVDHFDHKPRCTELKYLNIDYSQFEKSSNKSNQSLRKYRKKKLNKEFHSNCSLNQQKKIAYGNLSNNHKRVIDKNILNYSMMKINDILFENYKVYNSLSDDSNDSNTGLCQKIYSTGSDDAISFLPTTYLPKSKSKSDKNIKNISYYQSNEGSVLSCSNNNTYDEISSHSPKPAEVPPASFDDTSTYHKKLDPFIKSVAGKSNYLLADLLCKSTRINGDVSKKTEVTKGIDKRNLLSRTSLQSDMLLAKYIPGMNSLDLIVPLRPEPTVQVVQIPSPNSILQPVSSNSSSAIQTSSTTISIAKPLTEPISTQSTEIVASHTQTPHTQVVDTNVNNSNLLLTTVVNQGSISRIHGADQRHSSLVSTGSRNQNKASELSSSSETVISSEPISSLVNASVHEGSTQVTAHIQRVGQPQKQKLLFEESNLKSSSTQNSNAHIPGNIQVYEEPTKHPQSGSVSGSVYRFILKDGKILEQYCHSNQNSAFPLPDVLNESNMPGTTQQEHVIKLYKKKKEVRKDDNGNSENIQVPSLPQFHQAFRRQVYQSGSIIEGGSIAATSPRQFSEDTAENSKQESISSPLSKAVQTVLKDAETSTKCSEKLNEDSVSCASTASSGPDNKEEVNDLQSPSGVIFTCKVPISLSGNTVLQAKPVTILKATATQESLGRSSQKSDCDSKSKDSVIRSNMNALLAAALQNSPVKSNSSEQVHSMKQVKVAPQDIKTENSSVGTNKLRMPSPTQKSIRRPTAVPPSSVSPRFSRPSVHSSVNTGNQNAPPVVTIPLPSRAVQVLTTNINNSITNVPKVDNRIESAQLPQNSEQTSVSSTTLEQLREFESVLEQVTNTSQMKERGNAKRTEVLVSTTTAANSDFPSSSSSKVNTLFQTSLVSAISDLNSENRLSLTFISKASTTCTNTLISGSSPKITATTPVVVVQSCSRPLASPALSIASQNSPGSSPSTPPANSQPKINTKLSKPKTKSIGKTAPTTTLKVSTLPKPQQKPQEDEQTTQRIYAILDKYAEQLRNSPELKNKPAPRRRSNPPTNPSQSSKRKKSSQNKSKSFSSIPSCSGLEMSPGSEDLRTAGSEDSSNGVCQVTQTVNSPLSRSEEHSNPGGDISSDVGDSVDKDQRLQHRILLADQSGGSSRTVIVQDNVQPVISVEGTKVIAGKQLVVGGSTTVPLTLSLPGTGNVKQVLFPVPADGRPFVVAKVPKMYRFHQVTMPSGSPLIASASSGTVLLRQMCLNKSSSTLKQVKLPVVSQISTHMASQPTVVLPSGSQSFTLSTGSSIDSDSLGIALDNTILLNSSSTPASSLGFVQRNISKSNQSSNILSQNRQIVTQESSTNSAGCEVVTAIKTETIIKTENLAGDTSRTSDSCDDFKSDDVKFSIESNNMLHEKPSKGVSLISSPSTNNNWVQVFKEANSGNNILNKVEEKNIPRKETLDSKGSDHFEKSLDRKCTDDINRTANEQTSMKQQKIADASSYCIEGINDSKSIISNQLNDHWQFNIKLEKVCNPIKGESLSPSCLRDTTKEGDNLIAVQQSPLNQSQGLKRKVENTIFQIAFKRDKMKLSKDDFIQQRSAIAIERELRLQKSLSEECEDLGVDKPSTSDLFPEAELLLEPDPLSRDSLQGELFPRAESSSSSLSSPNRSPIFSSKCTNSWRKQKRSMLRHKFSYARSSSPSKKNLSDKTDSSRESTPINLNSSTSKTLPFDVKCSDSNFKCISKENECRDNENDISIECNDSDACNFSDVEDHNDTDILDTEGDSDNDYLQKSQEKNSCNSSSQKELGTDKSIETSLLRRLSDNTFNKSDYYLNKEPLEKRAVENSPWYHMIKGIQKETLDSEVDKSNHGSGEDMSESQNGVLDEYDDHQRSLNNYVSNKILHARKRKKVGLFLASPSEDSGSSIDTILAGSDSCSGFHDNLSKRSSSRGRVKKGCPCFNGSPEPTKKKKDIPVHDKTDKPCSTKTSFPFSNKKQVSKSTVKLVNRKR